MDIEEHIADAMEEVTRMYPYGQGIVRVGVRVDTPSNTIIVGASDEKARSALPKSVSVRGHTVTIEAEEAGQIQSGLLRAGTPDQVEATFEGGNRVSVHLGNNVYSDGTLGFCSGTLGFELRGTVHCLSSPAFMSCNHVIANYDRLPHGTHLNVHPHYPYATLSCFLPYYDPDVHADAALGLINAALPINRWGIKGIGTLAGFRRPRGGEPIRKSGATTGVTGGKVNGVKNINHNGRWWRYTTETSADFWQPGDSGALVSAMIYTA